LIRTRCSTVCMTWYCDNLVTATDRRTGSGRAVALAAHLTVRRRDGQHPRVWREVRGSVQRQVEYGFVIHGCPPGLCREREGTPRGRAEVAVQSSLTDVPVLSVAVPLPQKNRRVSSSGRSLPV
jgi:hypothetical protein